MSVSFALLTITILCILDLSNYLNILLLWLGVTGSNAGCGSEVSVEHEANLRSYGSLAIAHKQVEHSAHRADRPDQSASGPLHIVLYHLGAASITCTVSVSICHR